MGRKGRGPSKGRGDGNEDAKGKGKKRPLDEETDLKLEELQANIDSHHEGGKLNIKFEVRLKILQAKKVQAKVAPKNDQHREATEKAGKEMITATRLHVCHVQCLFYHASRFDHTTMLAAEAYA